jgi:uncharacterized membrane protein YdjX (TVP38/TMEM64 family)
MRRGHVVAGVVGVTGLLAFAGLRHSLGLELDPESMQVAVARMGVWAPLAYVGIVAFRVPLGLPSAVVLIGGGAVFGTAAATVYGATGILASAAFLFFAARVTGRDAIVARMPDRLRPFFELSQTRAGALVLAVGTGYPFGPATMFHLLAGVTGMAFFSFLVAVAGGALVRAGIYTFFGSRLIEGELRGLAVATGVLVAAIVLPLLFPRSRGWLLQALKRNPLPRGEAGASDVRSKPAPEDAPPGPA